MTSFWIVAAGMVAVALAVLLPPLLGRTRGTSVTRRALNLAVYNDRVAELEKERAEGKLSEADFSQAKAEIERELLLDLDDSESPDEVVRTRDRVSAVAVGIAVPLLAVFVYLQLGAREAIDFIPMPTPTASAAPSAPNHPKTASGGGAPSFEEMVVSLAKRLESEPDNLQGWLMLGRSYQVLKRHEQARDTFAKAYAMAPDNPDVMVRYAESLAMASNGQLAGAPEKLLEKALALQPDNRNALWMSGLAAQQRQDLRTTLKQWEKLQGLLAGEEAQSLNGFISQVREQLGLPAIAAAAPPAAAAPAAMPPRPAPAAPAAGASEGGLAVKVTLAPELAAQAAPSDTVFVFARAAKGPRMPLAIVRKTVSELPLRVTLDDAMAMTPAMKLSNFPQVVVGARVSKTGNAMPQSGDLEGASEAISSQHDSLIEVTIDRKI